MSTRIILASAALALSGCAGALDDHEQVEAEHQTREQNLAMVSGSQWGRDVPGSTWNGAISVCWETPGYSTHKTMLRQAVENNWGRTNRVSHIQFTGWGNCTSSSANIPIRLTCAYSGSGTCGAGNGPSVDAIGTDMSVLKLPLGRITNGVWSYKPNSTLTEDILHEFGHAIGFTHEHNRSDTPNSCTQNPQGTDGDLFLTPWDVSAMVSYCHPTTNPVPTSISAWDRDGLRRAYGFPGKWNQTSSWCGSGGAIYVGDFNGDGRDDQLCNKSGQRWVRYSNVSGNFSGATSYGLSTWCTGSSAKLLVGDFDDDGRDDLLCQNTSSKSFWVDLAYDGLNGTDYSRTTSPWCTSTGNLQVGDHNGDGRDDLLCHSTSSGRTFVNHSTGSVSTLFNGGTNFQTTSSWCSGSSVMYYGDFDGDDKADRFCQNPDGRWWIDRSTNGWGGTSYSYLTSGSSGRFCSPGDLRIADFNGDGRDDRLCHSQSGTSVQVAIQFNNGGIGRFRDASWFGPINDFCHDSDGVVHVGYFNPGSRADLLCHSRNSGRHAIHYPTRFDRITSVPQITLARPVWQSQDR